MPVRKSTRIRKEIRQFLNDDVENEEQLANENREINFERDLEPTENEVYVPNLQTPVELQTSSANVSPKMDFNTNIPISSITPLRPIAITPTIIDTINSHRMQSYPLSPQSSQNVSQSSQNLSQSNTHLPTFDNVLPKQNNQFNVLVNSSGREFLTDVLSTHPKRSSMYSIDTDHDYILPEGQTVNNRKNSNVQIIKNPQPHELERFINISSTTTHLNEIDNKICPVFNDHVVNESQMQKLENSCNVPAININQNNYANDKIEQPQVDKTSNQLNDAIQRTIEEPETIVANSNAIVYTQGNTRYFFTLNKNTNNEIVAPLNLPVHTEAYNEKIIPNVPKQQISFATNYVTYQNNWIKPADSTALNTMIGNSVSQTITELPSISTINTHLPIISNITNYSDRCHISNYAPIVGYQPQMLVIPQNPSYINNNAFQLPQTKSIDELSYNIGSNSNIHNNSMSQNTYSKTLYTAMETGHTPTYSNTIETIPVTSYTRSPLYPVLCSPRNYSSPQLQSPLTTHALSTPISNKINKYAPIATLQTQRDSFINESILNKDIEDKSRSNNSHNITVLSKLDEQIESPVQAEETNKTVEIDEIENDKNNVQCDNKDITQDAKDDDDVQYVDDDDVREEYGEEYDDDDEDVEEEEEEEYEEEDLDHEPPENNTSNELPYGIDNLVAVAVQDPNDASKIDHEIYVMCPRTGKLSEKPLDLPKDVIQSIVECVL